jgi:hypothetical protein
MKRDFLWKLTRRTWPDATWYKANSNQTRQETKHSANQSCQGSTELGVQRLSLLCEEIW